MNEQENILEAQIREIYGRVIYTHKTHEKCADILKCRSNILKYVEIFLSALTTTSILAVVFKENNAYQFIAALSSTLLLAITLYSKDFNLLSIAEKHKNAALNLIDIRERIFTLLTDIRMKNKSIIDLQLQRDVLTNELIKTYRGAPRTINKAYKTASEALQKNEEFTFSDAEIDKFLPEKLRKS